MAFPKEEAKVTLASIWRTAKFPQAGGQIKNTSILFVHGRKTLLHCQMPQTWTQLNTRMQLCYANQALGTARVIAQEIDPVVLTNGDMIDNGDGSGPQAYTGLAVLVHRINQRFGDQELEPQLRSVIEVMSFARMQGETLDNALTRFDVLLYRSSGQAGFDLSGPGKAFMMLFRCAWPNLYNQQFLPIDRT